MRECELPCQSYCVSRQHSHTEAVPSLQRGLDSIEKSFQSDTSQGKNFVDALAKLRVLEAKPLPFKILLEFEDEPRALVTTKA